MSYFQFQLRSQASPTVLAKAKLPVWLPKGAACHASKVTCFTPCLWKAAILDNVKERRSFQDPCQPSSCSCIQSLLILGTVPGPAFSGALALKKFLSVLLTQAPLSLARDGLITGGRNLIKLADEKKWQVSRWRATLQNPRTEMHLGLRRTYNL